MVNATSTMQAGPSTANGSAHASTSSNVVDEVDRSTGVDRLYPYDWTIAIDARFSERDILEALNLLKYKVHTRGYRPPNKYVHILLMVALNRHDKYLNSTYRTTLDSKNTPDPLPSIALHLLQDLTHFPNLHSPSIISSYLPSYTSSIDTTLNYSSTSTGTNLCIFGAAREMMLEACFNGERCRGIWGLILEEKQAYRQRREEVTERRKLGVLGDAAMPKVMRRNYNRGQGQASGGGGDGAEGNGVNGREEEKDEGDEDDEVIVTKSGWDLMSWMITTWEDEARNDPNKYSPSFISQIPPVTTYQPLPTSRSATSSTQPRFQLDRPLEVVRQAFRRPALIKKEGPQNPEECREVDGASRRRGIASRLITLLTQAAFTTPPQISRIALRDNLSGLYSDFNSSEALISFIDELLEPEPRRMNDLSGDAVEFLLGIGEDMEKKMVQNRGVDEMEED